MTRFFFALAIATSSLLPAARSSVFAGEPPAISAQSANSWVKRSPLPTPRLAPYRCASWNSDEQVAVVFGGEGSHEGTLIYDPWRNEWRWPKPAGEPAPRSGGNMAYDAARKLHVLFGSQFTDDPIHYVCRRRDRSRHAADGQRRANLSTGAAP